MTDEDWIDVGELVRITNGEGFRLKEDDTLFDPSLVELTVRAPDGTVTDLSGDVQTDSTGLYYADMTPDAPGRWRFKWYGDDIITQSSFLVRVDRVGEVGS